MTATNEGRDDGLDGLDADDSPDVDAAPDALGALDEPAAQTYVGPFDREPWPDKLVANVVSPGATPRLHGYDVAGDLARHYGIADVAWLALRGELPSDDERAAFETALVLLSPTHIGQAPAHAAFLAQLIGALPAATVAVAAVGLGELARSEAAAMAPWRAWLERNDAAAAAAVAASADAAPDDLPACALAAPPTASATDAVEAEALACAVEAAEAQAWLHRQMLRWFGPAGGLPQRPLHRLACAHALLHRLGWREPLAVELLVTWARLPAVIAEASFTRAGAVRDYPARVPDYRYVDERGAAP